jgi:hypothetical protein
LAWASTACLGSVYERLTAWLNRHRIEVDGAGIWYSSTSLLLTKCTSAEPLFANAGRLTPSLAIAILQTWLGTRVALLTHTVLATLRLPFRIQGQVSFEHLRVCFGYATCFQPGSYFRPDASLIEMRTAKSNWQKLYARGAGQFEYPKWWR